MKIFALFVTSFVFFVVKTSLKEIHAHGLP